MTNIPPDPSQRSQRQIPPGRSPRPSRFRGERGWQDERHRPSESYIQINEDAESVLSIIEEFAGVLPFDDKASPEVIKREFGLSKNAFKRAVGHLLKEGKIEIKDKRIYKK